MIELYACSSPNVEKVLLMLEECKTPYLTYHVRMTHGEQFRPEFVALNPNAKVPVIVDPEGPDGERMVVFESAAIMWYLAEKTGILFPQSPAERSRVLQWSMFQMGTLGPLLGQLGHFHFYIPKDLPIDSGVTYARGRYGAEARRIYKVLETRLAESEFLAGPNLSIADLLVIPWIRFIINSPAAAQYKFDMAFNAQELPQVIRWSEAVLARPGVQRGIAAVAKIRAADMEAGASADPDMIDRTFRRGRWMAAN